MSVMQVQVSVLGAFPGVRCWCCFIIRNWARTAMHFFFFSFLKTETEIHFCFCRFQLILRTFHTERERTTRRRAPDRWRYSPEAYSTEEKREESGCRVLITGVWEPRTFWCKVTEKSVFESFSFIFPRFLTVSVPRDATRQRSRDSYVVLRSVLIQLNCL